MKPFIFFDIASEARATALTELRHIHRLRASELATLDTQLRWGWAQGWHASLWLPYEWGVDLHLWPAASPSASAPATACVYWFARRDDMQGEAVAHWLAQHSNEHPAGLCHWAQEVDAAHYRQRIAAIQAAIARGEVYQINYTTSAQVRTYGHPASLYRRLRQRQPVPYGLLACLPPEPAPTQGATATSAPASEAPPVWTLSLSPELFLDIRADGSIHALPMKGTAARLPEDPQADERQRLTLRNDVKNRAENVMIVDLLRNDLGRVAVYGGVTVPSLFDVQPWGNVWQMTSHIHARLRPHTGLAELLRASFPSGSITGAPKRMSMEKIRHLESSPRGIYTGSIGLLEPAANTLGCQGRLNVAIRTLQLHATPEGLHQGRFGVGSGIVADSNADDEWRECDWKSQFLRTLPPSISLIETMRAAHGHCPLLSAHRQRLERSAHALRFPPVPAALWAQASTYLQRTAADSGTPEAASIQALRIEYFPDGRYDIRFRPATPINATAAEPVQLLISPQRLPDSDWLRRFKTSHRAHYDQGRQAALAQGAFDSLFFNHCGHLLEGGICSVFVQLDGQWHTPADALHILDSVMRRTILQAPQAYLGTSSVQPARLSLDDLLRAERIAVANAFQGLLPATLLRT